LRVIGRSMIQCSRYGFASLRDDLLDATVCGYLADIQLEKAIRILKSPAKP
jgi:AraC-like DNA-binding protein